jgi:hypothetical protein
MKKVMLKHSRIPEFLLVLAIMLLGVGCGKTSVQQNLYEKALLGDWAYIHDLDTTQASFHEDGTAKFEGQKYTYTCDEEKIHLTDKKDATKDLRYVLNGEQMVVYIPGTYTIQDDSKGEGIVGVWYCEEKKWTYEFTDKGTFMEDGALTGYYMVDEQAGTVKLVYGEALEDTVFYYKLTEDGLFIEYPWLMNKISE